MQQSTHEVPKSASQTVLSKVLITLHATRRTPHGGSRLLDATFAWSVKTRPAPSRIRRDASFYCHMTTGMHDNEYPPPPKLRQLHLDGIKSKTWCSRPKPSTSGLTSSRAPTETYRYSSVLPFCNLFPRTYTVHTPTPHSILRFRPAPQTPVKRAKMYFIEDKF